MICVRSLTRCCRTDTVRYEWLYGLWLKELISSIKHSSNPSVAVMSSLSAEPIAGQDYPTEKLYKDKDKEIGCGWGQSNGFGLGAPSVLCGDDFRWVLPFAFLVCLMNSFGNARLVALQPTLVLRLLFSIASLWFLRNRESRCVCVCVCACVCVSTCAWSLRMRESRSARVCVCVVCLCTRVCVHGETNGF